MASGPAEPLTTDQTHGSQDSAALEPGPELYADRPARDHYLLRLRHLMYLIAVVAVLCWLGILLFDTVLIGALLVIGGFVLLFAAVMGATLVLARARATRQHALLSVLAIAAEYRMPLAPAVLAFADQYRGFSYTRITNLAGQIASGTRLSEALDQPRKLVSRDAILLARIGEQADRLAPALRLAVRARSNQFSIWAAISAHLSYILGLLLVMQTIVAGISYFVVPKLEAIFRDFGLSLPRITILVIDVSHLLLKYIWITGWIPVLEIVLLVFLPVSFLSWSDYTMPLFDRLLGRRHLALVLRSLALTVDGGKPIALGLSTLAKHYPTAWVRHRLVAADKEVEHGADWIESLVHYRLIRPTDADVLKSATAVGNLAWALRELADTAERRLARKVQMLIQTLFPAVVVMLGVVVFVLAMAYFVPLVALIRKLTEQ